MIGEAELGRAAVVLAVVVATTVSARAADERSEAELARVVLLDQHGREDSLAAHEGHAVLAMVVQARRLRQLEGWERAVREALEDPDAVHYLRVADVRPGRGATRERVVDKLAGRVPEEVSILIDVEGRWREALGLDTDAPNLLLFDAAGRLVHRFSGRANSASVKLLAERIEALGESSPRIVP